MVTLDELKYLLIQFLGGQTIALVSLLGFCSFCIYRNFEKVRREIQNCG